MKLSQSKSMKNSVDQNPVNSRISQNSGAQRVTLTTTEGAGQPKIDEGEIIFDEHGVKNS